MAGIDFNICITDEACTYARVASTTAGWYLVPKKWCISASSGEFSPSRTSSSMSTPWIQQPFSGVFPQGTNKLLHTVVIPPDASAYTMNIGEIYFIYEDYYGNEFLYGLAQPTTPLEFTPGVSQSYSFIFALNNTTVADTFVINYTYPQDIQDHNALLDAHSNLLAKDGSRLATDIIKYETALTFENDRDIVDKAYVDSLIDKIKNLINTTYCPPGSITWWPSTVPPKGWLPRDGSLLSIDKHPKLYSVLGTIYGGNGVTTFALPDDRRLFIRGYDTSLDVGFGQIQQSKAPNITGEFNGNQLTDGNNAGTGAFYAYGSIGRNTPGHGGDSWQTGFGFNASRSSSVYQDGINEIRPINRNYLPIIKDDD